MQKLSLIMDSISILNKEFNKEQITSAQLHVVYNDVAVDEDGLEILDEDGRGYCT